MKIVTLRVIKRMTGQVTHLPIVVVFFFYIISVPFLVLPISSLEPPYNQLFFCLARD